MKKSNRIFRNSFKRILVVIVFSLILLFPCIEVQAAATTDNQDQSILTEEIINQQADDMNIDKINDQINKYYGEEAQKIIPEFNPSQILSDAMQGKPIIDSGGIFKNAINYILRELYLNIGIVIKLLVITVIVAILKNLQTSFLREGVGEIAFYACYIVMITILFAGFKTATNIGIETVDVMVGFMQMSVPILITLLISGGNVVTGSIFSPLLIGMIQLSASLLKYFFMPLIFFSTVLTMIGNISDKINISGICSLLKKVCTWTLAMFLTIFIGVIVVQGAFGSIIDGTTGKTVKYAVSTFIPVVGKYFAEAADMVLGCALILKNAAGIGVVIGIVIIAVAPLLKILALILVYKVSAAIMQMFGDTKMTNCVNEVASSLTYIFAITAVTAFMFFITITIMMGAGNNAAMIR